LDAVYDGPIDTRSYRFHPVILKKLPDLTDGDATLRTVSVGEGDKIVDSGGYVVDLRPGITLRTTDGTDVTFEAGGEVATTQMVVTFTLRTDVTWSDGEPLTADDSRYTFELAGGFEDPALRLRWERTSSYQVVDEHTVVWTGLPGYYDPSYFLNFYHPLPRHVWGEVDAQQILNTEMAHRKPLGWGAFIVADWASGDHITLVRNPHYFRSSDGLPHLDRVTFRFVDSLQRALQGLEVGTCDVIGPDLIEAADPAPLIEALDAGRAQMITSPSSEWEHLDFGIRSVEWLDRPQFFADERVRRGLAHCIDRAQIADAVFPYGELSVAHSYVVPTHPLYAEDRLHRWAYEPPAGRALLDEAGWQDADGDGIREAHGVPNIVEGTPFSVTLITTSGDQAREQTARILGENLAACGVDMEVSFIPTENFFSDGPDGPIFGRQFDLALFSWLNGPTPPCDLYLSDEIPAERNWWATSNNPGYASDDYDAACQAALEALPGMEAYDRFHREAQRIFSHDLPVLPLYFVPRMVVVRPDVTGLALEPGERTMLWSIEQIDLSPSEE
jgi:peptide/nickel transport system substrate-binding protein